MGLPDDIRRTFEEVLGRDLTDYEAGALVGMTEDERAATYDMALFRRALSEARRKWAH